MTSNNTNRVPTSVAKTAMDALHAKLSALSVGYNPIDNSSYNNDIVDISTHTETESNNKSGHNSNIIQTYGGFMLYKNLMNDISKAVVTTMTDINSANNNNSIGNSVKQQRKKKSSRMNANSHPSTNFNNDDTNNMSNNCSSKEGDPNKEKFDLKASQRNFEPSSSKVSAQPRPPFLKRQTPLVNAGYAMRIAAVSSTLRRFLQFHNNTNNGTTDAVNVVLLGCGMDVIGLWASAESFKHTFNVKLYEMDCLENCILKRQALIQMGLIRHPVFDAAVTTSATQNNNSRSDEKDSSMKEEDAVIYKGCLDWNNYYSNRGNTPFTNGDNPEEPDNKSNADDFKDFHNSHYTLLSTNFSDMSKVQRSFADAKIDVSRPTIVISELVLAYLGSTLDTNSDSSGNSFTTTTDHLLNYIAMHFCGGTAGSMFIAYEPIGSVAHNHSEDGVIVPVVEGYVIDYYTKFMEKLNRGRHHKQTSKDHVGSNTSSNANDVNRSKKNTGKSDEINRNENGSDYPFQPLGKSCHDVINRLRECGFDGPIDCCLAGTAAAFAFHEYTDTGARRRWVCPELFDEHAALALHLSCYGLCCATSTGTRMIDFQRDLCPWSLFASFNASSAVMAAERAGRGMGFLCKQEHTMNRKIICSKNDSDNDTILDKVIISSIGKDEEEQVRILYKETYLDLFEKYPSVKKMVKRALKVDLSNKQESNTSSEESSQNQQKGAVWNRYSNSGGGFWVATAKQKVIGENDSSSPAISHEQVIGCVGVLPCSIQPPSGDSNQNRDGSEEECNAVGFEIHRLAVHADFRGNGIGKLLLDRVMSFVDQRRPYYNDESTCRIVATTPAVMDSANQLYSSNGFDLVDEVMMGTMMIRTYSQILD